MVERDISNLGTIPMSGDRFHGKTCSLCVDFKACRKKKGRIDDSDYCHVPGKRFREKYLTKDSTWKPET